MLHPVTKEISCFWLIIILWALAVPACKQDTSIRSEKEEIYFMDYESPTNKWGYMDTLGRLIIEPRFDDVGFFSEGLANVNLEGRWGFIDPYGKFRVEPVYRSAWAFHEGKARVSPFDGPDHYITKSGKVIKSPAWSAADDFSESLAKVKVGNHFGFIDTTGVVVLPATYSRCWSFRKGLAVVSFDENLGVINAIGQEILPQHFSRIKIIEDANLVLCHTDDLSLLYDLKGNEIYRINDVRASDSDGILMSIAKGELTFLMDMSDGNILPGPGWLNVVYLGAHRWAARNNSGVFLLDAAGAKVSLKPFTQINRYVEGVAAYFTGKHWGYMDTEGKELTPDLFTLAWDYKNGFARAAFTEGIAFINRKQELAFYPPPGTTDMRDFTEGLAPVLIGNP